ncbi:hypothetical protein QMK38_19780 [Lysinibacillus fusiformis]|nr:hypothetical protein [Lysinibacillus fusiformis]
MLFKLFEPRIIERTIFQTDIQYFQDVFGMERTANISAVPSDLLLFVIHGILNRSLNLEEYLLAVIEQKIAFFQTVYVNDSISVDFDISYPKNATCLLTFRAFNQKNNCVADGTWKLKLAKIEVLENVENGNLS